jgi:hypothetical protein
VGGCRPPGSLYRVGYRAGDSSRRSSTMLRILVALAGLESATTGIRIRASKRQAAKEGRRPAVKGVRAHIGVARLVESEAAVLREAARRTRVGEGLAAIAGDLRSWRIPSPSGRQRTDATSVASFATPALWRPRLQGPSGCPGLLAGDPGSRDVRSIATGAQSSG